MRELHNRNRILIKKAIDLQCICDDIFHEFLESIQNNTEYVRLITEDDMIGDEQWDFIYTEKGVNLVTRMRHRLIKVCEAHFPEDEFEIRSSLFEEC